MRRSIRSAHVIVCGLIFLVSSVPHATAETLFGAAHIGGVNAPLASRASSFYSVDPVTGIASIIGPIGFAAVSGMDFDPASGVLYATGLRLTDGVHVAITIDTGTGAGTEIGPTGVELLVTPDFRNTPDLSFRNTDSELYVYIRSRPPSAFHITYVGTINTITGAISVLGPSLIIPPGAGGGLAFSLLDTLYLAGGVDDGLIHIVNQSTGEATPDADLTYTGFVPALTPGFIRASALEYNQDTGVLYAGIKDGFRGEDYVATIDPLTGVVTNIGQTVDGLDALAWKTCGDGIIAGSEQCDDNNNDNGDGCQANCVLPICGDGIVDVGLGEDCDDGGESATCDSDCTFAACGDSTVNSIAGEECDDGDLNDNNDCTNACVNPSCGDGIVWDQGTGVEVCDTGIPAGMPGACPTLADCGDLDVCTSDSVANDGTCDATCVNDPITTPIDDDGCCPPGATIGNDNDCPILCGDGVLSPGEVCDTGISASMPGACPTLADCDDLDVCTSDSVANDGTCDATCVNDPITTPIDDDGCCPPGAMIGNDNDCPILCGDGVLSPGEVCDTGIATGNAGACPTLADCDDADSCSTDSLINDGTCDAACENVPITAVGPDDGCCPAGGNAGTDPNCVAICGNGIVELGESCDDGNAIPDDACDNVCETVPQTGTGSIPTVSQWGFLCLMLLLASAGKILFRRPLSADA